MISCCRLEELANVRCSDNIAYSTVSKKAMKADQKNSNTADVTCSENIAYNTVGNGTEGSIEKVSCSRNIAYHTSRRDTNIQREEQCSGKTYEEVDITESIYY